MRSSSTPGPTPRGPAPSGGARAWLTGTILVLVLAGLTIAAPASTGQASADAWPDLDDATIRPGVRLAIEGTGTCTSNFVFKDRDTGAVFLGTASHCTDGTGRAVRLGGFNGPVIGHIAYASREHEDVWSKRCYVFFSCSAGDGNKANDFALIQITPRWADDVHPAVLHFGGPTGLAAPADATAGTKVITYGNSSLRADVTPLSWKEGVVVGRSANDWTIEVYTATPGIPGDSGSNALLGDGRALGLVNTLYVVPPGMNGVTSLHKALAFAEDVTGRDLELQTWPLLDGGVIPAS